MLWFIIVLAVVGLIAGFIARAVVPGDDSMSIAMTIAIGVIGSFVGGFIGWALFGKDPLIMFSAVGTVQDMRELVQMAADGHVKTHVSRTGALSELPEILDELEVGAYLGRAVITDLAH